nr:MAG TPA: hypothetical protein [Bacteriophage sp.]
MTLCACSKHCIANANFLAENVNHFLLPPSCPTHLCVLKQQDNYVQLLQHNLLHGDKEARHVHQSDTIVQNKHDNRPNTHPIQFSQLVQQKQIRCIYIQKLALQLVHNHQHQTNSRTYQLPLNSPLSINSSTVTSPQRTCLSCSSDN